MILVLTRGSNPMCVPLRLPASPAEEGEAFAQLDSISTDVHATKIVRVEAPIWNLGNYIKTTDINGDGYKKLKRLAEQLEGMTEREQQIFSGALDAESVNGMDDILRIASHLDNYELIEEVASDRELGGWLVENDMLGIHFPQAVRPYLDYVAIGAEYYSDHGGAYTLNGYVKRRDTEPVMDADRKAIFIAHLQANNRQCVLKLPASDAWLDEARRRLQVEDFCEVELTELECAIPYLGGTLPQDCIAVEDANDLALKIEGMEKTDGELIKYLSALCEEEPSTFQEALKIAYNIDNYERITEGTYEYGQTALRRIGANDEIIDAIDSYMDFEQFGAAMMAEDGVRQTEFGLVRRLNTPFPGPEQGQSMM